METKKVEIAIRIKESNSKLFTVSEESAISFREELNSHYPFVDLILDDDEFISFAKDDITSIRFKGIDYEEIDTEREARDDLSDVGYNIGSSLNELNKIIKQYLDQK